MVNGLYDPPLMEPIFPGGDPTGIPKPPSGIPKTPPNYYPLPAPPYVPSGSMNTTTLLLLGGGALMLILLVSKKR